MYIKEKLKDRQNRPPPKYRMWIQLIAKGMHFLFLIKHRRVTHIPGTHIVKSGKNIADDRRKNKNLCKRKQIPLAF